jgi:CheY-like chemotaxis protein
MMPKSILLIEDNPDLRSATREFFNLEGFTVLEAENGEAALKILESSHNISLIFLDMNMPVMCGQEFLHKAHDKNLLAGIKIIIFATRFPAEIPQAKSYSFLKKPADIEHLLTAALTYCSPTAPMHSKEEALQAS